MPYSYVRLRVFYSLMSGFQRRHRARRMETFNKKIPLPVGTRVLDLGGSQAIWENVEQPLNVTLLNLPGGKPGPAPSHHLFTHVDGDACKVHLPAEFDVVFSNSVIEHVGGKEQQAAFASEIRRMGVSYWVQTPSKWFPIEAHSGMPFWFLYPESMRRFFLNRWREPLLNWTSYIEETRVLSKGRMQALFPEAAIYVERVFGIPKSYTAWSARGQTAKAVKPMQRRGPPA